MEFHTLECPNTRDTEHLPGTMRDFCARLPEVAARHYLGGGKKDSLLTILLEVQQGHSDSSCSAMVLYKWKRKINILAPSRFFPHPRRTMVQLELVYFEVMIPNDLRDCDNLENRLRFSGVRFFFMNGW